MCWHSTTSWRRRTRPTSPSALRWRTRCAGDSCGRRSMRRSASGMANRHRWRRRWGRRWTTPSRRWPTQSGWPFTRTERVAANSDPRAMHPWATAGGALLALMILWDAFQTIILSRRVSRRFRPTRAFYRLLWAPCRAAATKLPPGNRRENVLMVFGPLSLLFLIAVWAYGLIMSFGLLHWGLGSHVTGGDGVSGFGVDVYMSGTT